MHATAATAYEEALSLPGYTVIEVLAHGASGVVYKAFDEDRQCLVAVKVLERKLFEDDNKIKRFLREVRLQNGLSHPSILPLHDAGFLETHPYIVTDFAPGGSLRHYMRKHAEPPQKVVWGLSALVAKGLDHAHGKGVIHRDLKPENILIGAKGEPLIADFGLAKGMPGAHSVMTQAGILLGTPSYIAPELVEGGEPGPAIDIYALGVIMFEMLAGGPPFSAGDLMELLFEKVHGELPPLALLRPDVPEAARALVLKCLERHPSKRPTAAALASALERFR